MRYSRIHNWDAEDEEARKLREEEEREFGQLENANASDENDDMLVFLFISYHSRSLISRSGTSHLHPLRFIHFLTIIIIHTYY